MPYKKGQFQGGHPRVPLRGFANLFRELDPAVADNLRNIFAEAEDLMDYHARSVPQRQTRRKLSGLVDSPTIVAEASFIGASIRWNRLDDNRITMYEVQISDTDSFGNPETLPVFETFFAIENLTGPKWIRVRGVRYDALTGNWSNTVRVDPEVTAPQVYTSVFYQNYSSHSEPNLTSKVRFAGSKLPDFYTLHSKTFIPTEDVGGMLLFGQVSNRLTKPTSSANRIWDRVRWRVNGLTRMEQMFAHSTDPAYNDPDTPVILPGDVPASFYGGGGYTAAFGPIMVTFPPVLRGQGPQDPRTVQNLYVSPFGLTWSQPKSVFRPSRYDLTPLDILKRSGAKANESDVFISPGAASQYLRTYNYGFEVPSNATVTGLEAQVKRRMEIVRGDRITIDLGKAEENRPLLSKANNVVSNDIFTDSSYGTMINLSPDSTTDGLLWSLEDDVPGDAKVGIFNEWTLSIWFRYSNTEGLIIGAAGAGQASRGVFKVGETDESSTITILFNTYDVDAGAGTDNRYLFSFTVNDETTPTRETAYVFNDVLSNLIIDGNLHHIVIRRDDVTGAGATTLTLDDVERTPTIVINLNGGILSTGDGTRRGIGIASGESGASGLDGAYASAAIWNHFLRDDEIHELFEAKSSIDYRFNYGEYSSAQFLQHWYLAFPTDTDIRDESVLLVTRQGGSAILRDDLPDKASPEIWPFLSQFNSDGTAPGIPHDNVNAIGYQTYGGPGDLWGFYPSPSTVNDFYFGFAVAAGNFNVTFGGYGFIDHVRMTVYYDDPDKDNEMELSIEAETVNFYELKREVFGGLFNGLQVAESFYLI